MTYKVGSEGQVVIPKQMRDDLLAARREEHDREDAKVQRASVG